MQPLKKLLVLDLVILDLGGIACELGSQLFVITRNIVVELRVELENHIALIGHEGKFAIAVLLDVEVWMVHPCGGEEALRILLK